MDDDRNMVDVVHMKKYFPIRGGLLKRAVGSVKAVDDVTFFIKRGETLGLVGESGCGKTTVGRAMMMLTPPTAGYVFFETPKQVVRDFTKLLELLDKEPREQMTAGNAVAILEHVERLVTPKTCEIKEDRKKRICVDASKLADSLRKAGPEAKAGSKEDSVRDIAEGAIDEVAKKYTINFKKKRDLSRMRSRMQFVFQDPFSSLNPKMLIKDIVAEPLQAQLRYTDYTELHDKLGLDASKILTTKSGKKMEMSKGVWTRDRVIKLLERVGLNVEHMYRFPHEFSGGQRQRIGIARALSVNPDFVVLDEPTSALDVSVQAQILNMLNDLQDDFGLTYLFISHDLSTIRYMCDRVAVMYLGKIAEYATKDELFHKPIHPYTEALLSVIPAPDPDLKKDRIILPGDVPSPANPPKGCRFHTRCPLAKEICSQEEPPLTDRGNEHFVACHVR